MRTETDSKYSSRARCIIGVIGGDDSAQTEAARQVGREIARTGQILLTGGEPVNNNDVKNAAMWGAKQAEDDFLRRASSSIPGVPVRARMIGILKSERVEWSAPNPCCLFLRTGLSSYERDAINGLTPDVLVVFRGGRGTLCELAFAAAASKPLRFYDSASALSKKTREHVKDGKLILVLEEALGKYRSIDGKDVTYQHLLQKLDAALDSARDETLDPRAIVAKAVSDAFRGGPLGRCGFPGISGETVHFEKFLERIDQCYAVGNP